MYNVSPAQPDRYHLKLFQLHIKDVLAYDDKKWQNGLQEYSLFKNTKAMLTLFCLVLTGSELVNPKPKWEEFRKDLAEDFMQSAQ